MKGRNTKYTEEIAAAICESISKGTPEVIAAQAVGISKTTFHTWKLKRKDFLDGVKKARAVAVQKRVERIQIAAQGGQEIEVSDKTITHTNGKVERTIIRKKTPPQWTADAWYLERQFCEHFGLNRIDLKELLSLLRAAKKDSSKRGGA